MDQFNLTQIRSILGYHFMHVEKLLTGFCENAFRRMRALFFAVAVVVNLAETRQIRTRFIAPEVTKT
jgi:hypothetical protein